MRRPTATLFLVSARYTLYDLYGLFIGDEDIDRGRPLQAMCAMAYGAAESTVAGTCRLACLVNASMEYAEALEHNTLDESWEVFTNSYMATSAPVDYAAASIRGNVIQSLQSSAPDINLNHYCDSGEYAVIGAGVVGVTKAVGTVMYKAGLKGLKSASSVVQEFSGASSLPSAKYLVHSSEQLQKMSTKIQSLVKQEFQFGSGYVNLASQARTNHIIFGEGIGRGGHLWPGAPGKTSFPSSWSSDKIMHHVSDIATDPKISWQSSGKLGSQRYIAEGVRENTKIKVVIESGGRDIVTAYPTR